MYRYRSNPEYALVATCTKRKRLLARPIVCRIFYSIRVAAFLPPRTFLGRRQYSFEALQQPEESVYNIVCVRVYIYTSRKGIVERSGNLGRLEIQFKTSRILAVVLIFRSIRPNFRPRERERPFRLDPRSSLRRTTRGKRWRRYPGDVAAAFQMLYPRVIDHAPLHVYIFRSMVYVFRATTRVSFPTNAPDDIAFRGPRDQFSTDSFEFRFHLSRNFQFSIPKEYDRSTYIWSTNSFRVRFKTSFQLLPMLSSGVSKYQAT